MVRRYVHLDIGTTVTRARAWDVSGRRAELKGYALAPTPPPSDDADLTEGVRLAYSELTSRLGESRFDPEEVLVTVSAGGEPKVACAGVVKGISGDSARRAALSAGATVTDLLAVDDGRFEYQRILDLKRQDISMVLMAGGVDEEIIGQGRHQLYNVARVVAQGLPERRGTGKRVPVVYAASVDGREEVSKIFGDSIQVVWTENVRSRLEEENLDPARDAVLGVFSSSIRQDPRFTGLGRFGAAKVLPSGHALGLAVRRIAESLGQNVMVISLDGDAVQVLTVIKGVFTRTVTPVTLVGAKDVARWLPSARLAGLLEDTLACWKMAPGSLPASWDDLAVYLAVQKQALLEAIREHSSTAIELRGIHRQRQIGETFQVNVKGGDTLVRMERIGTVCVTGYLAGLLSPAAHVSLLVDALDDHGATKVYLDRDGILESLAAVSNDGAIMPGDALSPVALLLSPGRNEERVGPKWAFLRAGPAPEPLQVVQGEISRVPIPAGKRPVVELHPSARGDVGDGEGRRVAVLAEGFGSIYVDARPRGRRTGDLYRENVRTYRALGVFPEDVLAGWERGAR
ncbi:MAG TPA: hypothetical protein GX500_01265 [Firmicutes bacterium]|nr:hypothetical protein [Candidatus Fermentithermobacillaceae bacterium]